MRQVIQVLAWLTGYLIPVAIIVVIVIPVFPAFAEPTPLTPAAAKYELEHAKSPQEAGQRIQQQSKDYKQELAKSPTPIPNAAKNAKRKTEGLFQLFAKRLKEIK